VPQAVTAQPRLKRLSSRSSGKLFVLMSRSSRMCGSSTSATIRMNSSSSSTFVPVSLAAEASAPRGAHGASRRSTRSRRQARVRACGGTPRQTARTGCLPGRACLLAAQPGDFLPCFGEVDVLVGESGQDLADPYCGGLAELALQSLLDAEHRLKLLAGEEAADEHLRVRGPDPVGPYPARSNEI
jgi:hypothetical protein